MRTALPLWTLVVALAGCGTGGGDDPTPTPTTAVSAGEIAYNLTQLNAIRQSRGLPLFTQDAQLDAFANDAAQHLADTNQPHGWFQQHAAAGTLFSGGHGFQSRAAENQGAETGWPVGPTEQQIDQILDAMMLEETQYPPGDPRRGHFETIVDPGLTRVGIGLRKDALGRLFFSNEFSD